jgi:hypothetical protein
MMIAMTPSLNASNRPVRIFPPLCSLDSDAKIASNANGLTQTS